MALSRTAALISLQGLTRDSKHLGLAARLKTLKLAVGMLMLVKVLPDRTTTNAFDTFKDMVQIHSKSMKCCTAAGGFDYLLKTGWRAC